MPPICMIEARCARFSVWHTNRISPIDLLLAPPDLRFQPALTSGHFLPAIRSADPCAAIFFDYDEKS